jgi:hypothetical protein
MPQGLTLMLDNLLEAGRTALADKARRYRNLSPEEKRNSKLFSVVLSYHKTKNVC